MTASRFVAALLSLLILAGSAFAQSAVPVDAKRALSLVNSYRASNGLPPLDLNPSLGHAAATHSVRMAEKNKLAHSFGFGIRSKLPARLRKVGYDFGAAAENIGYGYSSLSSVMEGWKNSRGHRVNLLRKGVTEMGIAAALGRDGRPYWTLILAAPRRR